MQTRIALVLAVTIGAFGSSACDQQAQAASGPRPPRAEPAPARPSDRAASYAKLTPWLTRHDELPRRVGERHCPDDVIRGQATQENERTLMLRVEDARVEKKSVLPLHVTSAVSSLDLGELEAAVTREEIGNLDRDSAARIDWLASRRFVGVFHVIDYSTPRWIHRLDRAKSEWVAGWLTAWLVVHDARTGDALCSTQVTVRNDTTGAPLQRRLRSETAERLTGELGSSLRSRTRESLARISDALRIEDAPSHP
jgi:hypothetical protein